MPRFRTPPGCTGLQMEDGTRYQANRSGLVEVDREDHARHIQRVGCDGGGHIHPVRVGAPKGVGETRCAQCRFVGYSWQMVCPKCSNRMEVQ